MKHIYIATFLVHLVSGLLRATQERKLPTYLGISMLVREQLGNISIALDIRGKLLDASLLLPPPKLTKKKKRMINKV